MSDLVWEPEALEKIEKIPVFVRGMVKGKIEKAAVEQGITTITAELLDKLKEDMGG